MYSNFVQWVRIIRIDLCVLRTCGRTSARSFFLSIGMWELRFFFYSKLFGVIAAFSVEIYTRYIDIYSGAQHRFLRQLRGTPYQARTYAICQTQHEPNAYNYTHQLLFHQQQRLQGKAAPRYAIRGAFAIHTYATKDTYLCIQIYSTTHILWYRLYVCS